MIRLTKENLEASLRYHKASGYDHPTIIRALEYMIRNRTVPADLPPDQSQVLSLFRRRSRSLQSLMGFEAWHYVHEMLQQQPMVN